MTSTDIDPAISPVGIMADSHGQVRALSAGLSVLKRQGCETLYHLGDICDSTYPENNQSCLDIIREHHVLAIKGNNEHAIAVNLKDHEDDPQALSLASYLLQLPLVRYDEKAIFAHSLPFEKELGLSAMVRIMEPLAAELFFRMYPGHDTATHRKLCFPGREGRSPVQSRPMKRSF